MSAIDVAKEIVEHVNWMDGCGLSISNETLRMLNETYERLKDEWKDPYQGSVRQQPMSAYEKAVFRGNQLEKVIAKQRNSNKNRKRDFVPRLS